MASTAPSVCPLRDPLRGDGELQPNADTGARCGQLDDDDYGIEYAMPGTYPITVTGNGGGIQQTTTVTLTVVTAQELHDCGFAGFAQHLQGNQGTSTITSTISGGFNSSISLHRRNAFGNDGKL